MFGGIFTREIKLPVGWKNLNEIEQLKSIVEDSETRYQVIFKHSTRCSISSMAFERLKSDWKAQNREFIDFYYLDLLNFREISNAIELELNVIHQSPQIIILKNGEVVHHASHNAVNLKNLN